MAKRAGRPPQEHSHDSSLSASMGYLVRCTFRAFTRSLEQRLIEHDVSISMWFFLRCLWERDGRTQKEVGIQLGLSPPTTVSAMHNLEKRGLIERKRNSKDRREIHVCLTQAGKQLKGQLGHYAQEVNAIALMKLTKRERQLLRTLLTRVQESLDAEALQGGAGDRPGREGS
jgi:MarR family transcriptional regulator, organic hydroperoxide resistance regulator